MCVGDSGDVVRYKTDNEDKHDAKYIAARFLLDRNGILSGPKMGLEDFLRDSSVEHD